MWKNGSHENPLLHTNFTALSFIEPELFAIDVLHCGNRIIALFAPMTLTRWPSYTNMACLLKLSPQIKKELSTDRHTWNFTQLLSKKNTFYLITEFCWIICENDKVMLFQPRQLPFLSVFLGWTLKKLPPTFVDISAIHANFCMRF